ncbi:MAG: DMT family transporter [Tidjanibacter sp.]|nr:DMT family transporter [Tidjanibacter sp.]
MLYLFLAIISASTYSILFKLFACREIDSLQAIAFNYLTATILGLGMSLGVSTEGVVLDGVEWGLSIFLGVMFMTAFVLMARSTKMVGVSVTTVSARVALVIPVVCSYLLLPNQIEPRWWAIAIILLALVMVIWQPKKGGEREKREGARGVLLPISVFLLFGTNNFCLKWAQSRMTEVGAAEQLSAAIFFFAALVGAIYYFFTTKNCRFSWQALVGGVGLGVANFFTTYFMILGLAQLPSAIFFPIYHVGIVALVATMGVVIFGERLTRMQIVGLVVAAVGIVAFFV